ncbi:MAG: hypothetical protein QN120_03225 [Armatimonadota bacterium]|nr:hypothetical protein [Armatimonadota bacterium]
MKSALRVVVLALVALLLVTASVPVTLGPGTASVQVADTDGPDGG